MLSTTTLIVAGTAAVLTLGICLGLKPLLRMLFLCGLLAVALLGVLYWAGAVTLPEAASAVDKAMTAWKSAFQEVSDSAAGPVADATADAEIVSNAPKPKGEKATRDPAKSVITTVAVTSDVQATARPQAKTKTGGEPAESAPAAKAEQSDEPATPNTEASADDVPQETKKAHEAAAETSDVATPTK